MLDRILLDAALDAGATLRAGEAIGVVRSGDRVVGVTACTGGAPTTLLARHVIGADGLRSTMAGLLGARELQTFRTDVSAFYFYVDQVAWTGYELHVADSAYAGVFPTNDGQACVFLCQPLHRADDIRTAGSQRAVALLEAVARVAPALGDRLRGGRVVSRVRGIVAPPNYVREAYGAGWSLVGDAGYHRDPLTGHGITDAFRDAELLAGAVHAALGDPQAEVEHLRAWQQARDEAAADVYRITRELCRFPAVPRFVELQVELAEALDREALMLASLPAPAGPAVLTA